MRRKCITDMQRFGSKGWAWTMWDDDQRPSRWRTDGAGGGLWVYMIVADQWTVDPRTGANRSFREWRQVRGWGDYSLPEDRKAAHSKLYREYRQQYGY